RAPADPSYQDFRTALVGLELAAHAGRQFVEDHEAHVVPVARVPGPGIAEAGEQHLLAGPGKLVRHVVSGRLSGSALVATLGGVRLLLDHTGALGVDLGLHG